MSNDRFVEADSHVLNIAERELKKERLITSFAAPGSVMRREPEWLVEKVLVPGVNFIFGEPKVRKSTFVLALAAIANGRMKALDSDMDVLRVKLRPSVAMPFIIVSPENNARKSRRAYEDFVLGRALRENEYEDFFVARNPFHYMLDDRLKEVKALIEDQRPYALVFDTLRSLTRGDENDSRFVANIAELGAAMASYGGALVIVHHMRKNDDKKKRDDAIETTGDIFAMARGSSALYGAADCALALQEIALTREQGVQRNRAWKREHDEKRTPKIVQIFGSYREFPEWDTVWNTGKMRAA